MDHAQLIHMLGHMWEQRRHVTPTFAVLLEFPQRFQKLSFAEVTKSPESHAGKIDFLAVTLQ